MSLVLRNCTIWGNLPSDKTDEQYPIEPVCTDCIAEEQARGEDSRIVNVQDINTDPDATCFLCEAER